MEQEKQKSDVRILVIDDREDNLFSIEAILEKDNYTIIKANSGRAALKVLLNSFDFSLILMDVHMPDLSGFETATIIYERDKLKSIPIIFITAHSNDEEFIFKGYRMGGVDYIHKPINPQLLRAKVSVFVDLYRKNRQLQQQEQKLLAANQSLQTEIEERRASEEKVRLLNEQLTQNNVHLSRVNEELDQFAYMASHDLQEPLRKIQVFSDRLLKHHQQDEEIDKYCNKIIGLSKRMQSLISNLLDFSRHSVSVNDFQPTNLNHLVKDMIAEMEIDIEKANATVTYSELPTISGIPGLLQQLFYNLVSNAMKFRREGVPPVIRIEAIPITGEELQQYTKNDTEKPYHLIRVSDNGIGFDNKFASDIFMVFKRLHNYQQFEGTGVGLAICKKIVERHNGFIEASGVAGEGAMFSIVLPAEVEGLMFKV